MNGFAAISFVIDFCPVFILVVGSDTVKLLQHCQLDTAEEMLARFSAVQTSKSTLQGIASAAGDCRGVKHAWCQIAKEEEVVEREIGDSDLSAGYLSSSAQLCANSLNLLRVMTQAYAISPRDIRHILCCWFVSSSSSLDNRAFS